MSELLPIALLGGVLGLDVVCFPQMMVSRPARGGHPCRRVRGRRGDGHRSSGATLELIALATLPFGASRYPEWGSAAVVGGAIAATLAHRARRARSRSACSPRSPPRGWAG